MTNMENSRPDCSMKDVCGGCSFQGIPYENQLKTKLKSAKHALVKNDVDDSILTEIVPSPSLYGYRNKMEYTFGDEVKGGPLNLGLHKRGSYISIINTDSCQLVPEDFNLILKTVRDWCREKGYPLYNKKFHTGLLRSLVIRWGVRTNELLINIVTSSESEFDEDGFLNLLMDPDFRSDLDNSIVGILHTINDNIADKLDCDSLKILYGRDCYYEEVLGLKFKVGAFSFFQSNVPAAERLYQAALDLLPDISGKTVYDLYCGTGTISQAMALKAKKVIGVEIVEEAVEAAKVNAQLNGLSNCEFVCGDVLKVLDDLSIKPDVIVVDPPRAGIHPKAMTKILSYGVESIIYISCNPKTLAVNLSATKYSGYKAVWMKVYDNFSFTDHSEAICLLTKTNG